MLPPEAAGQCSGGPEDTDATGVIKQQGADTRMCQLSDTWATMKVTNASDGRSFQLIVRVEQGTAGKTHLMCMFLGAWGVTQENLYVFECSPEPSPIQ